MNQDTHSSDEPSTSFWRLARMTWMLSMPQNWNLMFA